MASSRIVPLAESHFEAVHRVVDEVAREKRFLALTQAPPPEEMFTFLRDMLENDHPYYVALLDNEAVGWCDILPVFGQARAHVGVLGVGLVAHARHQGLGRRLMEASIAKAWAQGRTRIELTVREDNRNARALYERLGFQHEGIHRQAFLVDGQYYDSHAMALLRGEIV